MIPFLIIGILLIVVGTSISIIVENSIPLLIFLVMAISLNLVGVYGDKYDDEPSKVKIYKGIQEDECN